MMKKKIKTTFLQFKNINDKQRMLRAEQYENAFLWIEGGEDN